MERASISIALVCLLITAKLKSEEHFYTAAILLSYFVKVLSEKKGTGFSIIDFRASLQDPKISESTVAPDVRVCLSTILLLLIVGS